MIYGQPYDRDLTVSAAAVDTFYSVREMPYAIDKGHDASGLLTLGAGDCLAKAELLARRLRAGAGRPVRLVRWRYELPTVVPEVHRLPARLDLHRAVEVLAGGRWRLVDATYDPALAGGGLTVAEWDGTNDTVPAHPIIGPILVEGDDDEEITRAQDEIKGWVRRCPPEVLDAWRSAYIGRLSEVRAAHQARR